MQAVIRDIRERTVLNPDGTFGKLTEISYMVGTHGPYTLQMPTDTFDPVAAKAAVDAKAEALSAILPTP